MTQTRRAFLQSGSLAALAAMSGTQFLRAADSNPAVGKMKLGLVTYLWGKEWDVPTLIKNCTEANFQGIELRSGHKHGVELTLSAAERAEVRKRFADSPVEAVGIGSACEYHAVDPAVLKKNIEETKQYILLSKDIGGTGVKVRPNDLPKEVPAEKTIEQIGKALLEVSKFAADHGQEIRVEVHGRLTSNIEVMHKIMEIGDHPASRVCWNCNKQDLDGQGFDANFKLLQDKIATVHIHDLTVNDYPWVRLFEMLNGIQFSGWTMIEDHRVPKDIVAAMKANRVEWEKLRLLK
ncbi:sugar phosphate isomerase/epimerase family protein [Planctomicrobium sp. SH527]|uniref:sugar phosphate isomerase/epimerase family protein n=1 Tax=Planctomicrobium sp. SH527 TaxID=3448123 RepID=UPI003F5C4FE3